MKQFRRALDRAAQRRTDEIITYNCVLLLRRDEHILTKELTTNTQLQVASNGQDQAHRWLDNHEKIVEQLGISYPDNKSYGFELDQRLFGSCYGTNSDREYPQSAGLSASYSVAPESLRRSLRSGLWQIISGIRR